MCTAAAVLHCVKVVMHPGCAKCKFRTQQARKHPMNCKQQTVGEKFDAFSELCETKHCYSVIFPHKD